MSGSWIARLAEGKKSGRPGLKLSGLEFTLRQNLCRHRNSTAVIPCERPTPAMATKKEAGCRVMRVEVMKVAQQPAMAYDRISLSTPARSGKSGLLLKSLYAYSRPTALALLSVLTLFRDGQLACDFWRQRRRLRLHVRRNAPSVGLCKDELRCGRELLLDEGDILATVKRAEAGCLVSTEVDLATRPA